jgi:DNA-binding winged-HTH domains
LRLGNLENENITHGVAVDNNIKLLGYRIDNRLYYSVENKTLISLDGSEKSIPLRTTKARLLEYLLLKSGSKIITDQELLINIWDKYGLSSSSQRLWLVMRELKVILGGFNVSDDLFIRVENNGYLVDVAFVREVVEFTRKVKTGDR